LEGGEDLRVAIRGQDPASADEKKIDTLEEKKIDTLEGGEDLRVAIRGQDPASADEKKK
jgi:hypothetical protein